MNWPNHTDYQDAIQDPAFGFQDPELKGGTVACDALGLPRVMSGNFASVYELRNGERCWAVRCLVRQVVNLQARYAILTKHLDQVHTPFVVGFEFQLRGIRVHNQWYPIVKMDWVPGDPLHVFVEQHHGQPEMLHRLAEQFRGLLDDLRQHQIAHGDLQHGNILVTPGQELRLVDYDGMWVPAFGRGRSPELGHVNYQHPRRNTDFYDDRLDNFAALVIYASLLGLAAQPQLWAAFHNGDNLVLAANDFKSPQHSPVFAQLKSSTDGTVRALAVVIERCCYGTVSQVPRLAETLQALQAGALTENVMEGNRPASAVPGWLAELPTEPPSEPETRAAPAPAVGTTPTAPPSPAAIPRGETAAPQPLNLWACASIILACLALIPGLRVWSGLAAAASGIVGCLVARNTGPRVSWLAITGLSFGLAMCLLGLRPLGAHRATTEVVPAAAAAPPAVQTGSPSPDLPIAPAPPTEIPATPTVVVDYARAAKIRSIPAHTKTVTFLGFAPDSRSWISGSADGNARLWSGERPDPLRTLPGHTEGVAGGIFLPGAASLLTISEYNLVRAWDLQTGRLLRTFQGYEDALWPVAPAPDGRTVAVGARDRKLVRLLDLDSGTVKRSFANHSSWVRTVDFSPDNRLMASSCFDDTVQVWDLSTGDALAKLTVRSNLVGHVTFSPDASLLAAGIESRLVRTWRSTSGLTMQVFTGHAGDVLVVGFSPDGRLLATGGADRSVRVWDVNSGALVRTLSDQSAAVTALVWRPDGRVMLSGTADGVVTLWDADKLGLGAAAATR